MSAERGIVSCADALCEPARFDAVLDVRSESEFAEDCLPHAVSCPVLSDAERAEVGTLYRSSPFDARRRGAVLVARNIATLVETRFGTMPRDWTPLVYCWRGGQRSAALAHVLARIGWHAWRLDGGYRAYRRQVVHDLHELPLRLRYRVVCGATGSGKSRLLRHLAQNGAQVLDLEALAHHRGSVLGGLPSLPQPSQKRFESRLWEALRAFDARRPVFVESESRKVGNLRVPDELIGAMRASECVRIDLPLVERVKLLREEYAFFEQQPERLAALLDCLRPLHGAARVDLWKTLVGAGRWDDVVERLLVDHYDPAYARSIRRNFVQAAAADAVRIDRAQPEAFARAARELVLEATTA
jgi:tRNA 2-selenouridine synthase